MPLAGHLGHWSACWLRASEGEAHSETGEGLGGRVSCLLGSQLQMLMRTKKVIQVSEAGGGEGSGDLYKQAVSAQPPIPHPHPGTVDLQGSWPRSSHVSTQARNAEFYVSSPPF